jgi:hypothetical protein
MRNAYKSFVRKLNERDRLEKLGVDGRILLNSLLKKQCVSVRTGFIWLRTGSSGGLLCPQAKRNDRTASKHVAMGGGAIG